MYMYMCHDAMSYLCPLIRFESLIQSCLCPLSCLVFYLYPVCLSCLCPLSGLFVSFIWSVCLVCVLYPVCLSCLCPFSGMCVLFVSLILHILFFVQMSVLSLECSLILNIKKSFKTKTNENQSSFFRKIIKEHLLEINWEAYLVLLKCPQ